MGNKTGIHSEIQDEEEEILLEESEDEDEEEVEESEDKDEEEVEEGETKSLIGRIGDFFRRKFSLKTELSDDDQNNLDLRKNIL